MTTTNLAPVVEKVVCGEQTLFRRERGDDRKYVCGSQAIQKVDSAIHWINFDPLDNAVGKHNTYPLDSDLSGG